MTRRSTHKVPKWLQSIQKNKGTIVYCACVVLFWSLYFSWNNKEKIAQKLFPPSDYVVDTSKGPYSDALEINKKKFESIKTNKKTSALVKQPLKKDKLMVTL
jgi:hypothetical protein